MERRRKLDELSGRHERIPPIDAQFETLLGFAKRAGDEETWNRALRYFLDPNGSHGLDGRPLRHFLRALASGDPHHGHDGLFDSRALSWRSDDIRVDDQVPLDERRIDLVIRNPGNWFICVELKIWSSEQPNQTEDYVSADELGDEFVSSYPDDKRFYVYISRSDKSSKSDDFVDYSWEHIARHLRHTLADNSAQSRRGLSQIQEFTDTISNQLGFIMTSDSTQDPIDDRIELFNEYQEDLLALENAFEEFVTRESDRWAERFPKTRDTKGWNDEWYTYKRSEEQGHLYHQSWTFHPDGPDNLSRAPLVHLEFDIIPEQLRHGEMEFRLSVSGGDENVETNDVSDWREAIQEWVKEHPQFEESLPEGASWGSRKNHLTVLRYTGIQFDQSTFYDTIQRGFEEHYEAAQILQEIVDQRVSLSPGNIK